MATKKKDRCWPGYEPVPGKAEHSEGSCRPKAESKLKPSEQSFRNKRKKQLSKWEKEHPGSPRKAAQHLSAPGKKKTASKKKAAAKKSTTAKRRLKQRVKLLSVFEPPPKVGMPAAKLAPRGH